MLLAASHRTAHHSFWDEDAVLQITVCRHRMLFTCVQSLAHNNVHSPVVTVEVPFDILDH